MSVVRDLSVTFHTFPGNNSNALAAAPANLVCLSDSDRVSDEPSSHDTGGDTWSGLDAEQTLGQLMTEARKHRGLSREEVASQTNIPAYYVRMIESDSYDAIPDQLYLLPFFERYANFVGLDAHKIVSRFIRDFEKSENEIVLPPAPQNAAAKALSSASALLKSRWKQIATATAVAGVLAAIVVSSIRAIREDGSHPTSYSPYVATAPSLPLPAVASADAQTPDSSAIPPASDTANTAPQVAEQTPSPVTHQRRRSRGHRLLHHLRRLRRSVS